MARARTLNERLREVQRGAGVQITTGTITEETGTAMPREVPAEVRVPRSWVRRGHARRRPVKCVEDLPWHSYEPWQLLFVHRRSPRRRTEVEVPSDLVSNQVLRVPLYFTAMSLLNMQRRAQPQRHGADLASVLTDYKGDTVIAAVVQEGQLGWFLWKPAEARGLRRLQMGLAKLWGMMGPSGLKIARPARTMREILAAVVAAMSQGEGPLFGEVGPILSASAAELAGQDNVSELWAAFMTGVRRRVPKEQMLQVIADGRAMLGRQIKRYARIVRFKEIRRAVQRNRGGIEVPWDGVGGSQEHGGWVAAVVLPSRRALDAWCELAKHGVVVAPQMDVEPELRARVREWENFPVPWNGRVSNKCGALVPLDNAAVCAPRGTMERAVGVSATNDGNLDLVYPGGWLWCGAKGQKATWRRFKRDLEEAMERVAQSLGADKMRGARVGRQWAFVLELTCGVMLDVATGLRWRLSGPAYRAKRVLVTRGKDQK